MVSRSQPAAPRAPGRGDLGRRASTGEARARVSPSPQRDADPRHPALASGSARKPGRAGRRAVDERRFAVLAAGRPAAFCELYSSDGIGQVELVTTLPEYRNRGYGRAIVSAAVAASRDQGDELVFLVALADDWPRQLYQRIGFQQAGLIHRFCRPARGQRTEFGAVVELLDPARRRPAPRRGTARTERTRPGSRARSSRRRPERRRCRPGRPPGASRPARRRWRWRCRPPPR